MKNIKIFKKYRNCLLFLLLFFSNDLKAQIVDSTNIDQQNYQIFLRDGSILKGKIISKGSVWVIATLDLGILEIKSDQILRIQVFGEPQKDVVIPAEKKKEIEKYPVQPKQEEYTPINNFPTRYFFAPSAYNLPKGKGIYNNTWGVVNGGYYGISNNWSIGGGFVFFPLITPYYLSTKISWKTSKNVQIAGNFQVAGFWLWAKVLGNSSSVFLPQFLFTYGHKPYKNVTLGIASAFQPNGLTTLVSLSAILPLNYKVNFITQNHLGNIANIENYSFLSAGIRYNKSKHTWDFSLMFIPLDQGTATLPFFSYHLKIGNY
jgi:hypothetical protein